MLRLVRYNVDIGAWWWQRGASAFLETWIRRIGCVSPNPSVRLACVVRPGKGMLDIRSIGMKDRDPLVRFLWLTRQGAKEAS